MSADSRPRSRRRIRLVQTAAAGALFVLVVTAITWFSLRPEPGYVPGGELEGLTSELARDLPADRPNIRFEDVTETAGIHVTHFGTGRRTSQLPEDMGSGAAWGDFDRDGWIDLFVVNESGPLDADGTPSASGGSRSHLYRNLGDGTFEEMGEQAGLDLATMGMGAAWADFDNDGWLDLVVSSYRALFLFRNGGQGKFDDVTGTAGLSGFDGFWTGVSWGDYDRDGSLDLYVTGYVQYESRGRTASSSQYDAELPSSLNPSSFPPERNLLFRNQGDGSFEERARAAGVDDTAGRGMSAAWLDLDADGWPDLYVANDVSDNALFRNRGDGTFENLSHSAMVADYRGAMGIAAGDWDGDLDLDLFLTHWIAQENALYSSLLNQLSNPEQEGPRRMQFRDDADRHGLGQIALDYVGWATSFLDFDNDGRLDLFVVNGSTLQERNDPSRLVPMADQLFWNAGRERGFFDIGPVLGDFFRQEHVGRGGAAADYDRDGDLDLFVVNHSGPGVLLRNDGEHGAWLRVALEGAGGNRDAIGTTVTVHVAGRPPLLRVSGAQSSYLSQNEPVLHFGLGEAERADSVTVHWPDGDRTVTDPVVANRTLHVVQGGEARIVHTIPAMDERERVRTFWAAYREAGRQRIEGRLESALESYRMASELDPKHEGALYYRGQVALELGRLSEAMDSFVNLTELSASSGRAHHELGWLHLCTEPEAPFDPSKALDHFKRASQINPEHTQSSIDLAVAELVLGEDDVAKRRTEAVLTTDPDNRAARLLAGRWAWATGNLAAARRVIASATDRAERAAAGASSEGDTDSGSAALTVDRSRCRELPTIWSGTGDLDLDDVEALDRALRGLRERIG